MKTEQTCLAFTARLYVSLSQLVVFSSADSLLVHLHISFSLIILTMIMFIECDVMETEFTYTKIAHSEILPNVIKFEFV